MVVVVVAVVVPVLLAALECANGSLNVPDASQPSSERPAECFENEILLSDKLLSGTVNSLALCLCSDRLEAVCR